jgi:parallel beta-helix repeat protein
VNRKITTLVVIAITLSTLVVLVYKIPRVNATITIQPDGTIDPSSAPIYTVDSILYTFTDNVNDSIVIQRDNIVLDGLDFNLTGSGTGNGIWLYNRTNITIQNIVISNFSNGVLLQFSSNCNITGNVILECANVGVSIYDTSHHNNVQGNQIVGSSHALRIFNSNFTDISENNLTSTEHGVYFYQSFNCSVANNQIICERADNKYGVYLRDSPENTIRHNNISQAQAGIYVYMSSLNSLNSNTITDCGWGQDGGGIWLEYGALTNIQGNYIIQNRWHGLNLDRSPNSTISGNSIDDNSNRGIMLDDQSSYAQVTDNDIINNYKGIEVDGAHYNYVCENNLTDNQYDGIVLDYGSNNTICFNNIYGNNPGVLIGSGSSHNNLTGNTVVDSGWAVHLGQTSHNYLADNHVADSVIGITLQQTSGNTLRDNTLTNNTHNFRILSINLQNFLNDVDDSNTIEDKPIYYWINQHDLTLPTNASCVILVNCTRMTIQNLNLSYNNYQGVTLAQTTDSEIEHNNITSNQNGIWLWNASNNQINQNYLENFISIQLDYSRNNTIYNNTLTGSGNWGSIGFLDSDENKFFWNNFTDNYIHVKLDEFSINDWDDGYPEGGNYWDNYETRFPSARDENNGPHQNLTGSDMIWDSPYPLNDDNIDNYPLVPEFENLMIIQLLMIITLMLCIKLRKHRSLDSR